MSKTKHLSATTLRIGGLWDQDPELFSEEEISAAWRPALESLGKPGHPSTLQLYVNLPFCESRCKPCMYWSRAWGAITPSNPYPEYYIDHLVRIVESHRQASGRIQATNAYIGGGTPSLVPPPLLARLLDALSQVFSIKNGFVFEGHPQTLDERHIDLLAAAGVNKVSMGVQSLDQGVLQRIGRRNPPLARLEQQVRWLRDRQMACNIDVMRGLPGQSAASLQHDISALARLRPDTITVYRFFSDPARGFRLPSSLPGRDALPRRFMAKMIGLGYLSAGLLRTAEEAFATVFTRFDSRVMRRLWQGSIAGLSRLFTGRAEATHYRNFDELNCHVMGLGTGAFSRLSGFAWYRDVTSLQRSAQGGQAVLCGTRVSRAAECRASFVQMLAAGQWVNVPRLEGAFRSAGDPGIRAVAQGATESGLLQRVGPLVRLHPTGSSAGQERLLSDLIPGSHRDAPGPKMELSARRLGLNAQHDLESELTPCWRVLRQARRAVGLGRSPTSPVHPDYPALEAWLGLLGAPKTGARIGAATLTSINPTKSFVTLIVDSLPQTPLVLHITPVTPDQPPRACYGKSKNYAISFVSSQSVSQLNPALERYLQNLVQRTQGLDPCRA